MAIENIYQLNESSRRIFIGRVVKLIEGTEMGAHEIAETLNVPVMMVYGAMRIIDAAEEAKRMGLV